ncbi:hypothetical protein [Rhizobium leguminosarum]|uniref:hypothetical protein n=1 Tax=Rhizobium leguminosarum TaxID=384 RepID=UPI001031965C|nr:hypothetical protein [Rhizobium leguminosarum]TAV10236.1 hypothetical protein ELI37_06820 [Rhizobium leguminosarum]
MPHNVEDDFLQAYYRLSAGAPLNDELRTRAAEGKFLRINQSTVALEAGHSRTMIAQRAPGYERICALLFPEEYVEGERIAVREKDALKRDNETQKEKIARLSLDNLTLTRERDNFATQYAEACLSIALLQRKISVLAGEVSRREKNLFDLENPSGDFI